MEFYVNNEKLDIILENEKTVGDVLKSFEEECQKNNATTVNITLNGISISAEDFEEACTKPITDDTKLELIIISQEDIHCSFQSMSKECDALAANMMELPAKLQSGKDKEATGFITLLADFIDKFCHTASLSALFPSVYKNINIDGKPLNDFFAEFSQILTDFEQAISSKDTVLMGDLAEYEISPRLTSIANSIKEL